MTTKTPFLAALAGLTLCALSCVGAVPYHHPEIEAKLPDNLRDEYHVFASNCRKCHGLARPLQARVTDVEHWDHYVGRMMRTPGSGISTQEAFAILRFLHWYTNVVVNGQPQTPPSSLQENAVQTQPMNAAPPPPSSGAQTAPAPSETVVPSVDTPKEVSP